MFAKSVLFGAILWIGQLNTGSAYKGPNQLGPVRIDRDQSLRRLLKEIGVPASKGQPYCYQSQDGRRFLWIVSLHDQSGRPGQVLLSEFPNCVNRPVAIASNDLAQWRTEHGIGLASSETDVTKFYGKPTRIEKMAPDDARHVFRGLIGGRRPLVNVGERKLVYSDPSTLQLAEFGIREGRVRWILLSQEE